MVARFKPSSSVNSTAARIFKVVWQQLQPIWNVSHPVLQSYFEGADRIIQIQKTSNTFYFNNLDTPDWSRSSSGGLRLDL